MLFLKHYVLIFKALNNDQLTGELGILNLKWKPWIGLPLPKNCLCLLCHSFLILVFRLVTDLALQFENLLWICNLQLLFAKIQCYRKEMGAKSTKGACHGDERGWGSGTEVFHTAHVVRHTTGTASLVFIYLFIIIWFKSQLLLWNICWQCLRIYYILSLLIYSWSFHFVHALSERSFE